MSTMQTRRDLLQAHQLMTQRAALALICGEPDAPDQPLRRVNIGTICGVLAGVITVGVFAVLGLLGVGPATGLTQPGTLVVDKDTATAYVPCQNGKLCPVLNYASALLTLDTNNVNRVAVSQSSLARYSIGPVIGIPGLPQDLPVAANLVKGPWSVCTQQGQTVLVGGQAPGGPPLGTGSAVLVANPQGSDWVIWNAERLPITPALMLALFGQQPQQVPETWLDALPQGPGFAAPAIAALGQVVTGPDGNQAPAGQVFTVGGAGVPQQNFVLLKDGRLAPVTTTQAQLLERLPAAPAPVPISPSQATSHLSGTTIARGGLPATIPKPAAVTSPLCVSGGQVTTGGTVPSGATSTGATGGIQVDAVWLPPGHGALIGVGQPGTATTYFLLAGATRYALASPQVASVLGYDLARQAVILPASVVDLIPQGPAMDPGAATQRAPGG
ncbi:MAG TPA: type VII secretion protein EccB [Streptosporangiaceae bacterium]